MWVACRGHDYTDGRIDTYDVERDMTELVEINGVHLVLIFF